MQNAACLKLALKPFPKSSAGMVRLRTYRESLHCERNIPPRRLICLIGHAHVLMFRRVISLMVRNVAEI